MDYKAKIIAMLEKATETQLYCIYRLIIAYLD